MVFMAIVRWPLPLLATLFVPLQMARRIWHFARQHGELPGVRRWWVDHVLQLFYSRRRCAGGMDFYSPLAIPFDQWPDSAGIGMVCLITSSLLAPVISLRQYSNCARREYRMRMRFFAGRNLVDSVSAVAGVSALEARGDELMDKLLHEFLPSDRPERWRRAGHVAGGGQPVVCHLFWFLGHPEFTC